MNGAYLTLATLHLVRTIYRVLLYSYMIFSRMFFFLWGKLIPGQIRLVLFVVLAVTIPDPLKPAWVKYTGRLKDSETIILKTRKPRHDNVLIIYSSNLKYLTLPFYSRNIQQLVRSLYMLQQSKGKEERCPPD